MTATVTLQNVSKRYKQGFNVVRVVESASYTFKTGVSYAITGSSGSGKSTILALLAGLLKPCAGRIDYSMQTRRSMLLQLSYISQTPHFIQELTVLENVVLRGLIGGVARTKAYQRAQELLAVVGLVDKLALMPRMLSGGQQQRAALARALCTVPAFVLVDEPTSNLDRQTAERIIELLLKFQDVYGYGLIVATHDQSLIDALGIEVRIERGLLQEFCKHHERTTNFHTKTVSSERAHAS